LERDVTKDPWPKKPRWIVIPLDRYSLAGSLEEMGEVARLAAMPLATWRP
jgi:hypothetical protein